MAATYISARVIKHNNDVFLTPELSVGVIMPIPTPGAGGQIDGDYWAVPITNFGITTGFNFVPTTPTSTIEEAPTPQSFHVFRLVNQYLGTHNSWYAVGTSTFSGASPSAPGYIEVSQDAECCDESPRTLPTAVPALYSCQVACEFNSDGNYFFVTALPTDQGTYTANGYLNGETLPQITGATGGALQTQLNAQWTNIGSPSVAITWTVNANGAVIGVITDGSGADVLCLTITTA